MADTSAAETQGCFYSSLTINFKNSRPVVVLVLSSYTDYFAYIPPEDFGHGA